MHQILMKENTGTFQASAKVKNFGLMHCMINVTRIRMVGFVKS